VVPGPALVVCIKAAGSVLCVSWHFLCLSSTLFSPQYEGPSFLPSIFAKDTMNIVKDAPLAELGLLVAGAYLAKAYLQKNPSKPLPPGPKGLPIVGVRGAYLSTCYVFSPKPSRRMWQTCLRRKSGSHSLNGAASMVRDSSRWSPIFLTIPFFQVEYVPSACWEGP